MKKQTQHGNYVPIILALVPECSWRGSHPPAEQAQASGRLTPAEGPGGPDSTCRDRWKLQKKLGAWSCPTCQHDVGVQLLEVSWISMRRISADLLVDADHDAWHLGPAGQSHGKKISFRVVPIRDNTVLNGILQVSISGRKPRPRYHQQSSSGHPEPRVVPSDKITPRFPSLRVPPDAIVARKSAHEHGAHAPSHPPSSPDSSLKASRTTSNSSPVLVSAASSLTSDMDSDMSASLPRLRHVSAFGDDGINHRAAPPRNQERCLSSINAIGEGAAQATVGALLESLELQQVPA